MKVRGVRRIFERGRRGVGAKQARSQGGQGVMTPNEIDFAPAPSATKRKVVQTLAQCPPPVVSVSGQCHLSVVNYD